MDKTSSPLSGFSARCRGLARTGAVLLAVTASGMVSAAAMPAGSQAWMVFTGNACGPADTSICTTSNTLGANPDYGIPTSSFTKGPRNPFHTGSAEILPDRMRLFNSGYGGSRVYASMFDTYTVHGGLGGPFDIAVHLAVDGVARAIHVTDYYGLVNSFIRVEIGSWNPTTSDIDEENRVARFSEATEASLTIPTSVTSSPFETGVAVETSYSRSVSVGDVFDIGYNVSTYLAVGELDLLRTAVIGFDLPDGVWLTSQNGAIFGTPGTPGTPVPEPSSPMLLAAGLLALGLARRSFGSSR